jgi:hypothetical protein
VGAGRASICLSVVSICREKKVFSWPVIASESRLPKASIPSARTTIEGWRERSPKIYRAIKI